MKLSISDQSGQGSSNLKEMIKRQAGYALGRFGSRIGEINVRLIDLNGPKGGIDKRCKVMVTMRSGGSIIAEVDDAEFEPAIHRAMDRITRRILRHLEVAQTRARSTAASRKDETGVGG